MLGTSRRTEYGYFDRAACEADDAWIETLGLALGFRVKG